MSKAADHADGRPELAPETGSPSGHDTPATGQGSSIDLPQHRIRRTRLGGLWTAVVLFALVLLLLLIFILENGRAVEISYFGAHGHLALGVALLLAAALGVLLVVIPGTGRILQLRTTARRHRKTDTIAQTAGRRDSVGRADSPQQVGAGPGPA